MESIKSTGGMWVSYWGCRREERDQKRPSSGGHEDGGASRGVEEFEFNPGAGGKGSDERDGQGGGGWGQQVCVGGGATLTVRAHQKLGEPERWPRDGEETQSFVHQGPHPEPGPGLPRFPAGRARPPRSTAQAGVRARESDVIVWGSRGTDRTQNSEGTVVMGQV